MPSVSRSVVAAGLAAVGLLAGPAAPAQADVIAGLSGNSITYFDSANPGVVLTSVPITGLGGATLVGFDFRPIDGALVGVGIPSGGGLGVFQINPLTGAAASLPITFANNTPVSLSGTTFGVDFNPVPNALRIVSNTGQNLRITAGGAGTVNVDGALNGAVTGAVAAAYNNNVPGGFGGQTTLYDINNTTGALYTQIPPNAGTLNLVGPLGLGTGLSPLIGFDISATNAAFATIGNTLYSINLTTGAATSLGPVAGGPFQGIAIAPAQVAGQLVPEPMTLAVFAGLVGVGGVVARRRKAARA